MILVRMLVGFYYEFMKSLLGFTRILLILQILPDIAAALNIVLTCRKRALALPLNCNQSCSVWQDPQFSPTLIFGHFLDSRSLLELSPAFVVGWVRDLLASGDFRPSLSSPGGSPQISIDLGESRSPVVELPGCRRILHPTKNEPDY